MATAQVRAAFLSPPPLIPPQDTSKKKKEELPYPIEDRQGDFVTDESDNPFVLDDPSNIEKKVEYDPETDRFIITETLDGRNIKPPTYMTFDEYMEYERRQSNREYWNERAQSMSLIEQEGIIPKLYFGEKSNFGEWLGPIDIRPSGNIDLTFGGNVQKIDRPDLTENARKSGGFDFDMKINMNVVGKIGDKIKINMSYNTEATFDFENQIKLNYEGEEDDIIKSVEAGNVSFPLPTTLITGPQSLFGVKTKMQFGRLTISNVYSQQKSKSETLTIDQGAQTSEFEIFADQYDENRHFFLSHFFREHYNDALKNLPNINSLVDVKRVEVWITNRENATENVRDIVALMDLGEHDRINNPNVNPNPGKRLPDNNSNDLYSNLQSNSATRDPNQVVQKLTSMGLVQSQDFEKIYARKLNPSEYTFNPQLGYISLNRAISPQEVLAVAYEYTYNGVRYQVGDFAQDITNGANVDNNDQNQVVFLKMLKTNGAKPALPVWDLMMKNIYPLGAFQVNKEDFKLNVLYQDPGGGEKRYIPEGNLSETPLIRLLGLDNLNSKLDPVPDGIFDFVTTPDVPYPVTINTNNGRVIFPVLEPFGDYMRQQFVDAGEAAVADEYVYDQLYDSTKVIAQQFPQYNRFVLDGSYKSSVSNEISLGAFNVPEGSVKVTAGGQQLTEGVDYTVDYSLGRVKIINEAYLNSGVPINVSYENNALFGFQTKTLFGMRLDYWVSDKFTMGATLLHLRERPFTQKVNIGDDPIKNMALGYDFNYNTESQFLTWLVDKLPLYETKEPSSFSLVGEMARLKPGHQRAIGDKGTVYIDDFEGTRSSYDLKFPSTSWSLASTPRDAKDQFGRTLFPESHLNDSLPYGFNRAKLAWYNLDPLFTRNNSATPDYIKQSDDLRSNHYVREIDEQEVFPNKQRENLVQTNILTFDLAYYPEERGPYNYETGPTAISAGVTSDGKLRDPDSRWGGIMRDIDNTDFEASNVEFIEFWLLDPFIPGKNGEVEGNNNVTGGELYINLGNISEDILKDSRKFYENGLQPPGSDIPIDETNWGKVPRGQPITNSFDNDADLRQYQDLGFDGLNDDEENDFFGDFILDLSNIVNAQALQDIQQDPSSDNYHYYRGDDYDTEMLDILQRYKMYNGPQGNSPVNTGEFSRSATNIPNSEDINGDFTMDDNEAYFQYRIELKPGMDVGDKFITDKVVARIDPPNDITQDVNWYQFKIPIDEFDHKVGNISDFKSIQFIRMFLTGWEEPVVLRFAKLELVRNQWRRYKFDLGVPRENVPDDNFAQTFFNVSAVNVEENSSKDPIPYALPPGIEREQNINTTQNINALQNEQALQVVVCGLEDGDARAVYKTLNLDLRTYERIRMFIHGESYNPDEMVDDGDVEVFMRIGSDFTNNYYEYALPLKITPYGTYDPTSDPSREAIWPKENYIDFPLDSFYMLKLFRDQDAGANPANPFYFQHNDRTLTVVGNPDLGRAKTIMLGIRNPKAELVNGETNDDGLPKCVEVWFNELRLTGLDEGGGWAAMARMETKLADLGSITFATNMHTRGYGQIEQKVQERYKDDLWQYDLAGNIDWGKFLPKKIGFRIPMYASITQTFSTPQYDPYELDVPLKDKLAFLEGAEKKDYKRQAQTRTTIKSLNFTNVRIVSPNRDKKPRFYDPSNFNLTFAYTSTETADPFTESDFVKRYKAAIGYNYSPQAKYLEPFKKLIKSNSKYLGLIKDFNLNFIPSSLNFSTEMNRQFGETRLRVIDDEIPTPPTYDKYFNWDRRFGIKYNPTRSITVDYNIINNSIIDEPQGRLDTKEKKDSLWTNIKKFGRTARYQHNFSATYNAPFNKLPLLDWVQGRAGYSTSYYWATGGFTRDLATNKIVDNPLGNRIGNTQDIRVNGELNLQRLYDKIKPLKPYNSSRTRTEQVTDKDKRQKKIKDNEKRKEKIDNEIEQLKKEREDLKTQIGDTKQDEELTGKEKKDEVRRLKDQRKAKKKRIKKLRKDKGKIQNPENPVVSPFVRPFIAVKRISMNFSTNRATTVPGYMPKTTTFGMNHFKEPGWDFLFGYQPGQPWLDAAANQGWMSTDTSQNNLFMQTKSNNLNFKAVLEPFRDIRVDLTVNKTKTENYEELFKIPEAGGMFEHLSPRTTGSYTVSYIAVKTLFKKPDDQGLSQAFKNVEAYRTTISTRLSNRNPNSTGPYVSPNDTVQIAGYSEGYGPYSQDVLIPAFIAAYKGKNPADVKLNPFKQIPLPNWRITYNGLHKLPAFKKIFKSVSITHGYNSSYTVNSFQSNLDFEGNGYFQPSLVDSLNGNFIPERNIPQIVISEQFSPLIGIDITWINNITTKFDFKKTRNVSLSLNDYQISESRTTEATFGFGYRLSGMTFPFKIRGKRFKLKNEINFRLDISFRDNVTINQKLDQNVSEPTQGSKTIRIAPSIDYVINDRLNIRLFFDRNKTIPATSASYPITNTRAGITLRFSLTQ